jgi:hypothetical protein
MKSSVGHRNRKNPKSREAFQAERQERNLKRPKQKFDIITKTWSR